VRRERPIVSRTRRRLVSIGALAATSLALVTTGTLPGIGGTSRAAGGVGLGEPSAQTDDSVPAQDVTMIGSTPAESGGGEYETWGVGKDASGTALVRYARGSGWSLGPVLQNESGQPLADFDLDTPEAFTSHSGPSTIAGQMTEDGAGVLAGSIEEGKQQVLLVREPNNPANPFRETKPVPEEDLESGERLFGLSRAPLIAPLDEENGYAGALLVPVKEHALSAEEHVLHWSAEKQEWSSEKIELPGSATEFRVLGIGATSPNNAWLVAQLSSEAIALFRRQIVGGEVSWQPVAVKPGGEAGEPLAVDGEQITIPGAQRERVQTQVLTVTSQGVWVDGERPAVQASTTVFLAPGAEPTSWCTLERSPAGTAPCTHSLPQALPTGPSRSVGWGNPATPFGERVITGFPEGVTLRLDGSEFTTVLGLGGSGSHDQGATYGAAFANAKEGWLGNYALPVHLTLEPEASQLAPWPVPFRHALLAAAPQPEALVGSLSSEVLAVGDLGEVARYKQGKGWLPESLIGPRGLETPRLRAVAWPTPSRAYAVGDRNSATDLGEMWLWRGETGLWEPDPATPYNFSGNLLGIAFEPGNATRGYAVGESGVLLGYGKTWTQEPYPAESPCPRSTSSRCTWPNASFTSIAFSGSEAIVAYRILPSTNSESYEGGLIVNSGSGWHVDQGAAAAMGTNVPWAVAGLPDGGAAFGASQMIYEREGSGAGWQATATPFPAGGSPGPGSLELFRESGALRVIAAGSVPDTYKVESKPEAPPGSPPVLLEPYPLATSSERGVLRQTSTGWSDEEHELNNAQEPEGNWSAYDEVYEPDPIATVLVNSTGSQGWALGGFVEVESHNGKLAGVLDTADVDRYPAEGVAPPGSGTSAIPIAPEAEHGSKGTATFAIGGNAQCAAPCAARANARIGPDEWLANALQRADIAGVRAFLYTGPRLVSPRAINGPTESADKIDYEVELERYAEILGGSTLPAYAAGTETDLDEAKGEGTFEHAFSSFAQPLGAVSEKTTALRLLDKPPSCDETPECQSAYYSLESTGPDESDVRVIMLDDTAEPNSGQVQWLDEQLVDAREVKKPAIVVGNPDLNAQIAAGGTQGAAARAVEKAMAQPGAEASAYFFDSPEENIQEPLREAPQIPSFGSGTLGYVNYQGESSDAFLGASGFLLGQVEVDKLEKATNRAPVTARLIPNIGELALEAEGGTLLRRSNAALFDALARRPRAGNRSASGGSPAPETSLYIPIPSTCVGAICAYGLFPEYRFTSSNPEIGTFVKQNLAANPTGLTPELTGAREEPIPDEQSGLFCAYNPGTTIVTVSAGGLSASLPVTVQAGSVRRPCGTTPLSKQPASEQQAAPAPPPPPPAPAPAPAPAVAPTPLLPVPPPPTVPSAHPVPAPHPPTPFVFTPSVATPLLVVLPPPVPTPARPTPPSGTSAVTSPVEAPQKEEESEEATESVGNQAVAYRTPEHEPTPAYLLGLIVLAAFAGASVRKRSGRGRRHVQVAPATISTMRAQRNMSRFSRRR
jgi:hypothetical protein